MHAKPAILVVEHLNFFVHNVGPFFETIKAVIFYDDFAFLLFWRETTFWVSVLRGYLFNDLGNFVLKVILINKGKYLIFYCLEVSDLEDWGSFILVFSQQGFDDHL